MHYFMPCFPICMHGFRFFSVSPRTRCEISLLIKALASSFVFNFGCASDVVFNICNIVPNSFLFHCFSPARTFFSHVSSEALSRSCFWFSVAFCRSSDPLQNRCNFS